MDRQAMFQVPAGLVNSRCLAVDALLIHLPQSVSISLTVAPVTLQGFVSLTLIAD